MKQYKKRFVSALLAAAMVLACFLHAGTLLAAVPKSPNTADKVTLRTGKKVYYPGVLGDYSTCLYTVDGMAAYCLEPTMDSPGHGQYEYQIIEDNPSLEKALYYGYGGPGDVTGTYMPQLKDEVKYVFTHIAASYFYCGIKGFYGCTMGQIEACGALDWINYLEALPQPPRAELSLSDTALSASCEGDRQVTETTVLNGDSRNSVTIRLPEDVTFHNKDSGSTKTGGEVQIFGGTSFYFSAPMTVTGSWSSGTLAGSIQTAGNVFLVPTGSDTQDIGIYYKTQDGNSVSFTVEWTELAKVRVIKADSDNSARLSGAVFGIYRDPACRELLTTMSATNQDGVSEAGFPMTQELVYVKELTAPAGYRINTAVYPVSLTVNQTASVTIPDVEQLGNLTIYKEGEVLVGASSTEEGTVFQYENRRQRGAVFQLYAARDIVTPYGTVVYRAGELVADHLVTGNDGSVAVRNLHLGAYRVTEAKAPENFYNKGETREVILTYAGQAAEAVFSNTTFKNDRQKASVRIEKQDRDTGHGLEGGIFGLYASEGITNAEGAIVADAGTLIGKATTDTEGRAVFSADLPIGFGYEVRELSAPEGYIRNTEDVYSFRFQYTNDREATAVFSHVFADDSVRAAIRLFKRDKETGQNRPQGDAELGMAAYGLYARKDILHPDKKTGILYKAGEQVGRLTTDQEGNAAIENLYLGEYFIKEITPPVGYVIDETEYDLVCNYEGDLTAVVERECISGEQVIKQPFQIIKAAKNDQTDAELLSGAGFSAYLLSELNKKEGEDYDFDSAVPIVIGENGEREMFTNERGYACSAALPYGTYLVRETTTPKGYAPVKDFLVHITEHKPTEPQVWRVLLDEEFEAKLKIVKQDDETKKPVLAKNTEFKVYDLDKNSYVEQVTTYPTVVTHKSYVTDEQGYLILPKSLGAGHYRIEEIRAPFGYTLNDNYYEVAVDSDMPYQVDPVTGDLVIDVIYENHPVKGEIRIEKTGEKLKGYKKDFTYQQESLEGAEFGIYAAEDIYSADFQKDAEGNRCLVYASGEQAGTVTTDRDGKAVFSGLPLGTYRIKETKAPEGYVRNEAPLTVTLSYADQETPIISQTAVFENERQRVEIAAVKKDAENKALVEGAVFGLYAKTAILAQGNMLVEPGTLLGEAVSGADGRAVFDLDVPFGTYYIRELEAPKGYVSTGRVAEVTVSYQGQDVKTAVLDCEFENAPTKVSFRKTDLTTGAELSGATLTVLDQAGNVVDTWKSVKGKEHIIERLKAGETYILREELAPYGYLQAEEVTFTVADSAELQKVEMKDDVPTGLLLINKKGELLEDISLLDVIGGWSSWLFGYVTGSLEDVTFEVYALEDIKAADGESEDYYRKDELVGTITTDKTGYARLDGLPLGKYYIKETKTAEGYVLDGNTREADLTYRGQKEAVVTFSTDWQNKRKKAGIHVWKTEEASEQGVEGTVFALCAKEDITGADGRILVEADTVIEEKATDGEGKVDFEADLPIGFAYYVKETAPAPGFTSMGEMQDFNFSDKHARMEDVSYDLEFQNVPTVFEFTKTSLTDGKEIEGAMLQVTDENGGLIEAWVSGKEPHIIRGLVVGKTYYLTETLPAEGYVTAERIAFTPENVLDVQKVEMKDDITKLEISKTDLGGKELPGAKLSIFTKKGEVVDSWISGEQPHYIEMLPIGEYVLREETAPEGYLVAEDVRFEIRDTAEVQKVVMKDEAKPVSPAETPRTGEEGNIWLWLVLMGAAAGGIGFLVARSRREDRDQ